MVTKREKNAAISRVADADERLEELYGMRERQESAMQVKIEKAKGECAESRGNYEKIRGRPYPDPAPKDPRESQSEAEATA